MHRNTHSPYLHVSFFSLLLILAIPLLTACKAKSPDPTEGAWYGFAAYPGARELCTQFVLGTRREELHWRSFATADPPDRVVAFYRKKEPGSVIKGGASFTLRRGEDTTLEVYAASASGHPTCDQKPGPLDKSVIVATHIVSRGR